jgi:hypothetical protein
MTARGTHRSQLHRLIRSRASPNVVLAAARDVPNLSLDEAFGVLVCLRGDRRYPAAARRFCERLRTERPALTLADEAALLDALDRLDAGDPAGIPVLRRLFSHYTLLRALELLDEIA